MTTIQKREFELAMPEGGPAIPAYEAFPEKPWGSVLVGQEIFGVNEHIRSVVDRYAEQGLHAVAPAYFFEPAKGNIQLDYGPKSFVRGRELAAALGWDRAVQITDRFASDLKSRAKTKVGVVGFCWGGSLAWLSACRLPHAVDACVSYYGRATHEFRNEKPRIPVILHFGEHDSAIPMTNVREFIEAQPDVPVYVYDAGHGFNRNAPNHMNDFKPEIAALAHERTIEFFRNNLR